MTNIEINCKVCNMKLKGKGYEMCVISKNHLLKFHKEDAHKIDKLEIELNNIKDKYCLYLNGCY